MFSPGSVSILLLSLAGLALAHGGVTSISIGGVTYPGWQPYNPPAGQSSAERPYSSYNPILNPTDATLPCNDDGNAGANQQTITVAAGSVITDYYTQWTHAEGPYTVYLAACPSSGCTGVNTNSGGLKWFKIYELGLISGTVGKGQWANGQLMANLKWDTTIPANLKPGDYFIRWETLAIHQANTPQFYPECAQLHITGSGTAYPTSEYLVSIPGAWGSNDPGVNIDIYSTAAQTQTTYLIPGPRVYPNFTGYQPPPNLPGGGGSGPSSTSGGTPTSTGGSTTTSSASGPVVTKYGQCGGTGWTGGTVCAAGSTCTAVSPPYYYQCL